MFVVEKHDHTCTCEYTFSCQTVETKEEKEVLEHFAGVVSGCLHLHSLLCLLPLSPSPSSLSPLPLPPPFSKAI